MSDEMINDPNAKEEALFEYLKAGGHGVKTVDFGDLKGINENHLIVYEVPKCIVKYGFTAGASAFEEMIENIPDSSVGSLVFSFSGFAGSSRPLFMEKKVVSFVRGFLFGSVKSPQMGNAARALRLLFDETIFAFPKGFGPHRNEAYDIAGGLWTVAHAFPKEIFVRDETSPTKYSRDIDLNFEFYKLLLSGRIEEDSIAMLMSRGITLGRTR